MYIHTHTDIHENMYTHVCIYVCRVWTIVLGHLEVLALLEWILVSFV